MNDMKPSTRNLLEQVASWPPEDQDELAEYAREIQARRTGVYIMSDEERAAVEEGLAQLDRGEVVSEEEMADFWRRAGVK
jgi:predicted transcriptional regulator